MTKLTWDGIGDHRFEVGLDRGVLYLQDGSGIPWNGLVSISEKTNTTIDPVYFDGRKFNDIITLGDYSATLTAFTYPDEFSEFEGILDVGNGVNLADQRLKRFGLSYRTNLGDDVVGMDAGYKIHVVYNLIALPSDIDFSSISDSISPITFGWDISAVPIDVAGYEPTAQFIFDTTKAPPGLITAVEGKLYGSETDDPKLPPISYFFNLAVMDW